MIHLSVDSKIYVLAPVMETTGGIELAHQLVDALRFFKLQAFIVYTQYGEIVESEVTKEYRKYNIAVLSEIDDNENNLIILPEVYSSWIKKFRYIQLGFWWMSVDNYFLSAPLLSKACFYMNNGNIIKMLETILGLFRFRKKSGLSIRSMRKIGSRLTHFYQSTYAKHYLLNKNINAILPLSDYINTELVSNDINVEEKKDIILYNPRKGLSFTKKIIKSLPSYQFIPLQGLSRSELTEYFKQAKLYIDFGKHQGKDRIPREAAINGCCIISCKDGSAKYFEDIAIDNKYKFDKKPRSIPQIKERVKYVIDNYDKCIGDFEFYRNRILKEKETFYNEVEMMLYFNSK